MSKKQGLDTLPTGWQETITAMYDGGGFDSEVIKWIRDNRSTGTFTMNLWRRWLDEEEEFRDVIEMGQMSSLSWWEKQPRLNIAQRNFQSASWIRIMTNKFGWRDISTVQIFNTPRIDLSDKSPDQLLKILNDKIQKDREKLDSGKKEK
jgi:hypothetical protein